MMEHYCLRQSGLAGLPVKCLDARCDECPNREAFIPLKEQYTRFNIKPDEARPEDNVNLPTHYARFKIEPVNFICENKLDWFQGNVVKYVCRHDAKNGVEDLKKAIRYLEMYVKFLQNDKDWWKRGA